MLTWDFTGLLFSWRGPAPFFFVRVPQEESAEMQQAAAAVSYGWGMVPVTARVGGTEWTTSLFPKDDGYLLPVKAAVRAVEALEEDTTVAVRLSVDLT